LAAVEKAIESVAKRAAQLDSVRAYGQTVETAGQKIVAEVGIAQRDLAAQVDTLREQLGQMRKAFTQTS
jgi:hypothetical protein